MQLDDALGLTDDLSNKIFFNVWFANLSF